MAVAGPHRQAGRGGLLAGWLAIAIGVGRMSQTEYAGRMLIDRGGEVTIGRRVVSD